MLQFLFAVQLIVSVTGVTENGISPYKTNNNFTESKNNRPNLFVNANKLLGITKYNNKPHSVDHPDFSYGKNVWSWSKQFFQCGGNHQSPIDIAIGSLHSLTLPPLIWSRSYSTLPAQMSVTNKIHTVALETKFDINEGEAVVSGGPLNGSYLLHHIHFHWGSTDYRGSEHTIEEKSYPMEMHAVHYRNDLPFVKAVNISGGLAVIGYIYAIDEHAYEVLDHIIDHFGMLKMNREVPIKVAKPFKLKSLLDLFTTEYVTYNGSLTTPPCFESVTWLLSPYTIPISRKQLQAFRSLYYSTTELKDNFRPTQPINDRNITFVITGS